MIIYFGTRNIFFGALISACIATSYFVTLSLVSDLAVNGQIPGALGAGLGPLVFGALGITWLKNLR